MALESVSTVKQEEGAKAVNLRSQALRKNLALEQGIGAPFPEFEKA
ncbi:hypothetical protein [Noviherbaspirillum denitrificans]|nr:hypothetical protein [Noviherbaspirillum denitrificans]